MRPERGAEHKTLLQRFFPQLNVTRGDAGSTPQITDPDQIIGLAQECETLMGTSQDLVVELEHNQERLRDLVQAILRGASHAEGSVTSEPRDAQPRVADPAHSAADPKTAVVAWMFGSFRFDFAGTRIRHWNGQRSEAILKYLLVQAPRPVSADLLMDTFWRDASPDHARRNLHQAVYALRKGLRTESGSETQLVVFVRGHYQLDDDLGLWCDVHLFQERMRAGRVAERRGALDSMVDCYQSAMELYTGEFLEDSMYDEWASIHRESLRAEFQRAAQRVGCASLAKGRSDMAIDASRRMLDVDPCDESAHRTLMEAYTLQGRRYLAARQYDECVKTLADHLGIGPDPRTVDLKETLFNTE